MVSWGDLSPTSSQDQLSNLFKFNEKMLGLGVKDLYQEFEVGVATKLHHYISDVKYSMEPQLKTTDITAQHDTKHPLICDGSPDFWMDITQWCSSFLVMQNPRTAFQCSYICTRE